MADARNFHGRSEAQKVCAGSFVFIKKIMDFIYCCTVHSEDPLIIKTNKCTNMYCIILKHILKHLKSSYMFRSIDHHQGAHVVPC
jgi:hypothetical protein